MGGTSTVRVKALQSGNRLRFSYENFYNPSPGNETPGPNDITVSASLQYVADGAIVPVRFGGATSRVLKPGEIVWSDEMMFPIKKGQCYYIRQFVSVATLGMKWPHGPQTVAADGEGANYANPAAADLTPSGVRFGFVWRVQRLSLSRCARYSTGQQVRLACTHRRFA